IECIGTFEAVGEAAIEAGAADVEADDGTVFVYSEPQEIHAVQGALEAAGIKVKSAESGIVAKSTVEVSAEDARKNFKLIDALEELDDVQRVTANFEVPPEVFAEIAG
ncbi:MAG: hypothetical protein RIS62_809, partial [Chloroflexota bacterium]